MESFLQNVMNLNLLVCKRPKPSFQTVDQKKDDKKKKSSCQSPFIPCGKAPTPLGVSKSANENDRNHKHAEKSNLISMINKSNGALERHKRWLREAHLKRQKLRQEREDAQKEKQTKLKRFKKEQARKRSEIRNSFNDDDIPEVICVSNDTEDENDCTQEEVSECAITEPLTQSKPAWAMTKGETEDAEQSYQLKEETELLEFVDGLNFQEFYDDLELNVLMAQVKERIHTLEKDMKKKRSKLNTVIESQMADDMIRDNKDVSAMNEVGSKDTDNKIDIHNDYDDAKSIADSIKTSGGKSVSSIHSQKSLRYLISEAKRSLETIHEGKGEFKTQLPIIITHTDDGGARLAQTKSLDKLPFKNRNPAL